jgi:hypothetical protein
MHRKPVILVFLPVGRIDRKHTVQQVAGVVLRIDQRVLVQDGWPIMTRRSAALKSRSGFRRSS